MVVHFFTLKIKRFLAVFVVTVKNINITYPGEYKCKICSFKKSSENLDRSQCELLFELV